MTVDEHKPDVLTDSTVSPDAAATPTETADVALSRPRKKGIYLLPNLFTTAALFAGFYAIVSAMQGQFEAAAVAVFIAMILDSLDGRVARLTHTQTAFGAEYDSLADVISFGLAPALIVYQWSLVFLREMGPTWGKIGWLAAFVYVACAALRLARFNTQIGKTDKRFFVGLASPAAAALMVGMVWVLDAAGEQGRDFQLFALVMTLVAGLLMVSNFPYYSFKDINLRERVPFIVMIAIALGFALATIDPPKVLFAFFVLYAASGPILGLSRQVRKRQRRNKDKTA